MTVPHDDPLDAAAHPRPTGTPGTDPAAGTAVPGPADRTADAERPEYSVDQVGDDQAPVLAAEEPTTQPRTAADAPPAADEAPVASEAPPATEATSATVDPLVPASDAVDYKARWDVIQQGFVDDPRSAVTDADKLVSEVLERLSTMFDEQHRTLEGQWSDGEPDTEDLRSALQRYRAFFQRLLTI